MALNPRQILSFVVIGVIAATGFGLGSYLFNKKTPQSTSSNSIQSAFEKPASQDTPSEPTISGKAYIISPPSSGVMINPFPVEFQSIDNDKAIIFISGNQANNIKIDYNVLVYDQNKILMDDIIGKVTSILDASPSPQDIKKKVTITFYGIDHQKFSSIKSGDIVLKDETASFPRLPLSALVLDKEKNESYWVIDNQSETKTTAHLKSAQGIIKTDEFFVPKLEFGASHLFILNPDEKLKEGAVIQTMKILYQAPPNTKDEVLIDKIRQDIDAKNDVIRNDALYSKTGELTPSPNDPKNAGCAVEEMSQMPEDMIIKEKNDAVKEGESAPPNPEAIFTPACGIPEDAALPLLQRP